MTISRKELARQKKRQKELRAAILARRERRSLIEQLEPRQMMAAEVSNFRLWYDSGYSSTDKVSSDTRLAGALAFGSGNSGRIDFDHNGDGNVDGTISVVNSGGSFKYEPRDNGLSESFTGALDLKYRAVELDSYGGVLNTGSWTSFPITVESRLGTDLQNLHLVSDTGSSSTDKVTSDLRLAGAVTWDGYGGFAQVEFDLHNDGTADGYAGLWWSGESFEVNLRNMGLSSSYSGALPLKYRIVEFDSYSSPLYTSDWQSFAITVETPRLYGNVNSLQLVSDTGSSSTDKVTSDPRVSGSLSWDGYGGSVQIEFDHNNDGTYDGYAGTYYSGGSFTYDPRNWGLSSIYSGELPLRYRIVERDDYYNTLFTGSWQDFTITLEPQRINAVMSGLALVSDTGTSSTDKLTTDPRLTGNVSWDGYGGYVDIQFDHNNDNYFDGYAGVWSSGSSFNYDPRSWGLSSEHAGVVPMRYRFVEYNENYTAIYTSSWTSFEYTMLAPRLNATLSGLALVSDTGTSSTDKITSDPRVSGSVTWDGYGGWVDVQFDHNSDGSYDGYAGIWSSGGSFTYDPRNFGLSSNYSGELPLKYRTVEYSSSGSTLFTSNWANFPITIEQPRLNATLTGPQLVVDDGASSSDRVTTDPRVSGSVTWDGYGGSVQLQFDHDANGSLDGYAGIYSSGNSFTYDPRSFGLSSSYSGSLPLKYRVVEMDSYGGTLHTSNWQDFAITISGAEPSATLANLHLVSDTGTSGTDKITSDPRLAGNVNWDGYSGYVTVEFDHTGNGSVDGSSTLYMSGDAFQYDPRSSDPSLSTYAGTLPLKYRLVENTSGGSTIVGSWQTFTYTLVGQSPAPEITVVDSSIAPIADEIGSYSFGTTVAGSSIVRTFTIVNQGTGTLTLDSNSLSLPSGFVLVSTFDSTVDPDGGTTTFSVRLEATAPGVYSGTLSFTSNDADESPYNFTITGHVLSAEAEIDVERADGSNLADGTGTLNFGATATGTAVSRTITIRNIGYSTLVLDDESLSLPSGYSLVSGFATSVSPGESTYLTVQLDASSAGTYGGQLSFTTNDTSEGIFNFQLTGTVEAPTPEIVVRLASESNRSLYSGSDSVDFSWAQVGGANARTLLIENTGTGTLTLDSASLVLPIGFRVATPFATTVVPGASTSLIVEFAPGSEGFHSGELSFVTNDSDEGLFRFTLHGEGYGSGTPSGTQLIVGLRNDTGISSSDKVTSDYRIEGEVTGLAAGESARIAIDLGTDGIAETEITVTAASPEFAFDPTTIASSFAATLGAKLLRFKVTYFDDQDNEFGTGNWQTFSYALEAIPVQITPTLLTDTGPIYNDSITYLPPLSIAVQKHSGSGNIRLEFDHDADGDVDGSAAVPYSYTVLQYDPRVSDSSFAALRGEIPLRYRAVMIDGNGEPIALGAWNNFTIEQTGDTRAEGLLLSELGLSLDSGVSSTDRITSSPVIYFVASGELETGSGAVDFDFEGNGSVDTTQLVDQLDQEYLFDPRTLGGSEYETNGAKEIFFRVRKLNELGLTEATGDWQPFRFTLESAPTSTASLQNVALLHDTGASSTDRVTSDGTIKGIVQSGEAYSNFAFVEVDWTGNGTVDDVIPAVHGLAGWEFRATPRSLSYGTYDTLLRVREWSDQFGQYRYSAWSEFSFELVAMSSPAIASLKLEGIDASSSSYVTAHETTLLGEVATPVDRSYIIYLDANGDEIAEATAYSDGQGKFSIETPIAAAGNVSVRLRTAVYDPILQSEILGPWRSFAFSYESKALANVSELSLQTDTGTSATDGITKDPTVKGKVTPPTTATGISVSGVLVEFDEDGDGDAEGFTSTSTTGEFSYRPLTLLPGTVTIRARSRAFDENLRTNIYGTWKEFTFTLEATTFETGTVSLSLAKPSATNSAQTTDPAIKGTTVIGSGRHAVVEFDHNGDGTPEGSVATDTTHQFTYVPIGMGVGSHTIRARVREWNPVARQLVIGDWIEMNYTVVTTTNQTPTVTSLALASDSGSSASDLITGNSLLTGTINNPDGAEAGLPVEIDVNSDGLGDTIVFADSLGQFSYQVEAIPYGANTVQARAIEWDEPSGQYLISSWQSLSFTYVAPSGEAAYVSELTTVTPPYYGQVLDPILTGQVINDGSLKDIVVELDFNGDNTIDVRTLTDSSGHFEYRPIGLAPGNYAIRARARELDTITGQLTTSGWTTLWFELLASNNQVATLSPLALVEDTGTVGDGKSANPSLKGTVTNDGLYSGLVVQIDHNGDDIADGVAGVDSTGNFTYTPHGLAYGTYTFRARVKELNQLGTPMYSSWQTLALDYQPEAYQGVKITTLNLASDTGNSATDGATSNPSLTGSISGTTSPIVIRFDHNGDEVTDGTATTDAQGNFSYSPSGLTEGLVTIRAAVEGTTTASGLRWTTKTFVYSTTPDGETAQGLVHTHLTYTAAWQRAGDDYNAAISAANSLYTSIRDRAALTYDASVASSTLARDAALTQAQESYSLATAAAESTYASQMADIQGQFMLDLAAYGGDTTTFQLREFAWPTSPSSMGLEIPSDASQPTAPQMISETSTYYDWSSDTAYQGAIAAANNSYQTEKLEAENIYSAAKKSVDDTYNSAVSGANRTHSEEVAAAKKAYDDALLVPITNAVDMVAATSDYSSAVANATAQRDRILARIDTGDIYQQRSALENWRDAQMYACSTWEYEARIARERDIWEEYHHRYADIEKIVADRMAKADYDYGVAVENAAVAFKHKELDRDQQVEQRKINAAAVRDKAINAADAKRDKAIATAQFEKTKALAVAAKAFDSAVEKARLDSVKEQSDARTSPLASWADGLGTRWTTYYKEIVGHDVDHVSSIVPKAEERYESDLATAKTEIEKIAEEKKKLAHEKSDLTLTKKNAEVDSDKVFSTAENVAEITRKKANETALSEFKTKDLEITRDFKIEDATNHQSYTKAAATLDRSVDRDAPVYVWSSSQQSNILNQARINDYYEYFVGTGSAGSESGGVYALLYSRAQSLEANDLTRATARNNAWHTYQTAVYGHARTRAEATATAAEVRDKSKADAAFTFTTTYAEKYSAYLKSTSEASKTAADEETASDTTYNAHLNEAEVQRNDSEAETTNDYRTGLAEDHKDQVGSWGTALDSAWGTLQKTLADTNFDQIVGLGAALVTNTSTLGGFALTHADEIGSSLQQLVEGIVAADDTETQAHSDAIVAYATKVATERKAYAYKLAAANKDHDFAVAEKDEAYRVGVSERQRVYENAVAALKFDAEDSHQTTPNVIYVGSAASIDFRLAALHMIFSADDSPITGYGIRIGQADVDYLRALAALQKTELASQTSNSTLSENYHTQKAAIGDTWQAAMRSQHEGYEKAKFAAERTRAEGDVSDHQTWVLGIQNDHVTLAEEAQSAANTLADALAEATTSLATDQADAARAFSEEVAAADKSYTDDTASADVEYSSDALGADNSYSLGSITSSNAYEEAIVGARGNYEETLHQQHLAKLQSATVPAGAITKLNMYRIGVAEANLQWSQDLWAAREQQQASASMRNLASIQGGTSFLGGSGGHSITGSSSASVTQTSSIGEAYLAHTTGTSSAVKSLSDDTADAIRDVVVGVRTAESSDAARQVKAEKTYDVDRAIAARTFHESTEAALLAWASDVLDARGAYWDEFQSEMYYDLPAEEEAWEDVYGGNLSRAEVRDAAIEVADDQYDLAIKTARKDFALEVGDAQIDRAHTVTQSAATREDEAGQAVIDGQSSLNSAETSYIGTTNGLNNASAAGYGLADKIYDEATAKINEFLTELNGNSSIAYATALANARTSRGVALATAEADYHIAMATTTATRENALYQSMATANPADPLLTYHHFLASQSTAYVSWLSGMKPAYASYIESMSEAVSAESIAFAEAQAAVDRARAQSQRERAFSAAERWMNSEIAETSAYGDYRTAEATSRHARDLALPGYERTLQMAYQAQDESQLVAHTTAERDYWFTIVGDDDYNYYTYSAAANSALTAARAAANTGWAEDYSTADLAWTTSVTTADTTYRVALENHNYGYELGVEQRGEVRTVAEAQSDHAKAIADSAAERTFDLALTAASNARRTAEFTAAADFQGADYQAKATAIASISTAMNLPWLTFEADLAGVKLSWWTSPGRTEWLDAGIDLNEADTTYAIAAADVNAAHRVTIAGADRDLAISEAARQRIRRTGELAADRDFAITFAGVDQAYQLELAQTRNYYRNAQAALTEDYADEAAASQYFFLSSTPEYAAIESQKSARSTAANDRWLVGITAGEGAQMQAHAAALLSYATSWRTDNLAHQTTLLTSTRDRDLALIDHSHTQNLTYSDLQRDYQITSATNLATAIESYNSATNTPWSTRATEVAEAESAKTSEIENQKHQFEVARLSIEREMAIEEIYATFSRDYELKNADIDDLVAQAIAKANQDKLHGETLSEWANADTAYHQSFNATGEMTALQYPSYQRPAYPSGGSYTPSHHPQAYSPPQAYKTPIPQQYTQQYSGYSQQYGNTGTYRQQVATGNYAAPTHGQYDPFGTHLGSSLNREGPNSSQTLEQFFGLVDSTGSPLSAGSLRHLDHQGVRGSIIATEFAIAFWEEVAEQLENIIIELITFGIGHGLGAAVEIVADTSWSWFRRTKFFAKIGDETIDVSDQVHAIKAFALKHNDKITDDDIVKVINAKYNQGVPRGAAAAEQARNSLGQFMSRTRPGQAIPGATAVNDFVEQAERNGLDVLGREITVNTPFGQRRYDIVVRDRATGAVTGIEIKSSRGAFHRFDGPARQQFAADRWLREQGGLHAVGGAKGLFIDDAVKILWEVP